MKKIVEKINPTISSTQYSNQRAQILRKNSRMMRRIILLVEGHLRFEFDLELKRITIHNSDI